jgi:hypothetical protein
MNQLPENFPITTAQDNMVLMHRDAHFGGKFSIMIDYYENEGKGVNKEIDLKQIYRLAELEKQAGQDIAPYLLSGPEAEKVGLSRMAYKRIKDLYEDDTLAAKYPRLLADLILSEEETPEKEIQAVVNEKGKIVPAILEILRSDELLDPLFPGYGHAPALVAKCLGMIGDKRAIIALFEMIGEGEFDDEAVALEGLKNMGQPAKDFLLNVVKVKPYNLDNERAAIALLGFKDDPVVAETCLNLLLQPEVRLNIALASYLTFVCEGLTSQEDQAKFLALASDPAISKSLKQEMLTIAKTFVL